MARISGVDLPPNKRSQIGLTYIYGIGKSRATEILNQAQIGIDTKIRDLSEDELTKIRAILEQQSMCGRHVLPFVVDEPIYEIDYVENLPAVEQALRDMETGRAPAAAEERHSV